MSNDIYTSTTKYILYESFRKKFTSSAKNRTLKESALFFLKFVFNKIFKLKYYYFLKMSCDLTHVLKTF